MRIRIPDRHDLRNGPDQLGHVFYLQDRRTE